VQEWRVTTLHPVGLVLDWDHCRSLLPSSDCVMMVGGTRLQAAGGHV